MAVLLLGRFRRLSHPFPGGVGILTGYRDGDVDFLTDMAALRSGGKTDPE